MTLLKQYWHIIVIALVGLLILALAWSVNANRHLKAENRSLVTFQQDITRQIGDATQAPKLKPVNAKQALNGLIMDRDDARRSLASVTARTQAAKVESDRRDKELAKEQTRLRTVYVRDTQPKIDDLKSRRPTGNAEKDCKVAADDSAKAWSF